MATVKPDCNLCKHHVQGAAETEQPITCWDCKGHPVSLPNFELDEEVALAMQAGGVAVTKDEEVGMAQVNCGSCKYSFISVAEEPCRNCGVVNHTSGSLYESAVDDELLTIPPFLRRTYDEDRVEVDSVNHPSHYTSHPSGVECIAITEHMNFCCGNAIKYIWRAGLKSSSVLGEEEKHLQDLKKARWYIDREIERREKDAD